MLAPEGDENGHLEDDATLLQATARAMLPADRTLEPACGWFVLGTWLFLTVVALGFVTLYGNRTPRWEDWFFVPFVTGAQRVDLAWLWEDARDTGCRS